MKKNTSKKPAAASSRPSNRAASSSAAGAARSTDSKQKPAPAKSKTAAPVAQGTPQPPKKRPVQTPSPTPSLPPRKSKANDRPDEASDNGAVRKNAKGHPSPETQRPTPEVEEPPRKVQTYLNDKQLAEFRELLLEKRRALTGDVERLADQALNRKEHGFNEQSTMPIHMADLGSDTWEQDFNLGLLANEQGVVREIDEALRRIDDRTYGICMATDAKISIARLRAKPWARYCIEYERAREEGRVP